jgi:universal stress protein E
MQLLRKCPCPVWLAGPSSRPRPRRIMAAVDAGSTEPGEAALNQAILDLAVTIRDFETAQLSVVYAWSAFGYEFLQRRMSASDLKAFTDATHESAARDLERAVAALGARRAGVEALAIEGEPYEVLPGFAESHEIDLVVMGTVARTGLAGFVMGNTAERILSRLRGSVLAVKPAGFVSPVTP